MGGKDRSEFLKYFSRTPSCLNLPLANMGEDTGYYVPQ